MTTLAEFEYADRGRCPHPSEMLAPNHPLSNPTLKDRCCNCGAVGVLRPSLVEVAS